MTRITSGELARTLQSPHDTETSCLCHKEVDMRSRINRRSWKLAWSAAIAVLTIGIAGLAAAQIQKLGGPFYVSVLPAQAPTWTYTVSTDSQNELASVEILSDSNLSDCTITAERLGMAHTSKMTDKGHDVVLDVSGKRLTASLRCSDHESGEVFLRVTDTGGISRTIGPIAGPK